MRTQREAWKRCRTLDRTHHASIAHVRPTAPSPRCAAQHARSSPTIGCPPSPPSNAPDHIPSHPAELQRMHCNRSGTSPCTEHAQCARSLIHSPPLPTPNVECCTQPHPTAPNVSYLAHRHPATPHRTALRRTPPLGDSAVRYECCGQTSCPSAVACSINLSHNLVVR